MISRMLVASLAVVLTVATLFPINEASARGGGFGGGFGGGGRPMGLHGGFHRFPSRPFVHARPINRPFVRQPIAQQPLRRPFVERPFVRPRLIHLAHPFRFGHGHGGRNGDFGGGTSVNGVYTYYGTPDNSGD